MSEERRVKNPIVTSYEWRVVSVLNFNYLVDGVNGSKGKRIVNNE